MEAPEKIYLQDSMSTDTIGDLWPEWFDAKVSDNSIEYIRTDAFIERATWWLSKHFYDEEYQSIDNEGTWIDANELIEDFKKYMEE